MRRIVLDAQYSVMTSALTMALKQGGPDFQVQNAGPKTKDIVKLCRSCRADVLLLEVCPQPEGVKGEIQVAAPDHPARGA